MKTLAVLPVTALFALLLAAWAWRRGARRLALYGALFLLGQGATLQLIRCGNKVGYQHLHALDHPAILMIVVVEAAVVLARLRELSAAARRLLEVFTGWQLLGVGLVFFVTSATLSADPLEYGIELVAAALLQLVHLGALVLAVKSVPRSLLPQAEARFERLPQLAALFVFVLAATLCWFSYQRHPHIPDEVVYLYHARYLAKGMLTMPLPAAAPAFNVDLMMYDRGVWYCPVPIGWPAVLAIGAFFHVEWLVNPILGGLGVLLAHAIVRDLYGEKNARLAAVLIATSPWYVFLAMSFMTHTLTLVSALLAGYGLVRLRRTQQLRWALLTGAFVGVVSLIRPLEGVACAATLGLWSLWFGTLGQKIKNALAMAASAAMVGALQLPYNRALTGDAFKFPIMLYTDKMYGKDSNALGFGPNRGLGWSGLDPFPGHGLRDVLVNANLNLFQINCELHGWAVGSLLLVALALLSRRLRRADWGFVFGAFTIVFLHSFYWFSGGPDFGARYWFLVFLPGIVLSVRGLEILSAELDGEGKKRALLAVLALSLSCLVSYFPWRAVDKYHHYRLMRPDIRELAEAHHFGRSLVIVRGNRHPDYASAVTYNPIDFDDPVPLYAWDQDQPELRRMAVEAYPDRPVYLVDGPSVTGRGFELRAGPLHGIEQVEAALEAPP